MGRRVEGRVGVVCVCVGVCVCVCLRKGMPPRLRVTIKFPVAEKAPSPSSPRKFALLLPMVCAPTVDGRCLHEMGRGKA